MGYSTAIEGDDAPHGRGESERLRRMLNITLHSRRFGSALVVVRNISHGGMGGTTQQWLSVGEELDAELPNIGRVPAKVAWTDGVRFGLMFASDIDPARVTRDTAAGRDVSFRVMDRFRPETSAKRPPINLR